MEAETLNCPMCGASVATDSAQCRYCEARLATVACPSCFAMMFLGSMHCPRCGAAAERSERVTSADKKCPRCKDDLQVKSLGDHTLLECADCLGLWLDVSTFEKICADWEQQAADLDAALVGLGVASLTTSQPAPTKVSYVPCPECKQLMNRVNFARCSGVIVDICKKDGVWFDRNELSRIIEFIKDGGLDVARSRQKAQMREERIVEPWDSEISYSDTEKKMMGIASAGDLLKFLLK